MSLSVLDIFLGHHPGVASTWFKPGELADEQPITLEGTHTLGERFVRLNYTSSLLGKAIVGELTIGYADMQGQFEGTWIDAVHMGNAMMHLVGQAVAGGVLLKGTYFVGQGQRWGWEIELVASNGLPSIQMYNLAPGYDRYLGVSFALD